MLCTIIHKIQLHQKHHHQPQHPRSGPISAMVSTDRTGYVPGELIAFAAEVGGPARGDTRVQVDNQSTREMTGSFLNLVEVALPPLPSSSRW